MFTPEIAAQIKCYVYRLIDPRNGETFYVGKGTGNRVFDHAKAELGAEADELTEKLKRIREIRLAGLNVQHIIHRHGLDDAIAFEVEAALIDAYPGAANLVSGQGYDDRGTTHSSQIIERYSAKEVEFHHPAILININRSATERGNYEAVRYAWKLDPKKAEKAKLVLAVNKGLIVDVFSPERWLPATTKNFPGLAADEPGRWGFEGRPARGEVAKLYLRRRLPEHMRKKGAANPIRYKL